VSGAKARAGQELHRLAEKRLSDGYRVTARFVGENAVHRCSAHDIEYSDEEKQGEGDPNKYESGVDE
jgi:hypothetical protein